jgi:rhamnogalacturonan endolyase
MKLCLAAILLLAVIDTYSAESCSAEIGDAPAIERIFAGRQMEYLGRAPVALQHDSGVFLSWRLLGTDPDSIAFDVYRGEIKLNLTPIVGSTNFVDAEGTPSTVYSVAPRVDGKELARTRTTVWPEPFHRIPLKRPQGGTTPDGREYSYSPNDTSVGDLDGDGDFEFIVKWEPSNAQDNSRGGFTGKVFLDAYQLDGTQLWRIDLGRNIRAGAHYTQFLVYDFDGDGKAELACRTSDGTRDGCGKAIGDPDSDHRSRNGYVLSGPEFLTVFNGETGTAMATVPYIPARGQVSDWGDDYGNRVDRFLAGVAYLDGRRPSMVFTRGYYTRTVQAAFDWQNGELSNRWVFDSEDGTAGNRAFSGQGAHSLTVGDVDNDGRDEIVFGAATIDDDGTGLYSTGLGHGDALHLGDFDPARPELEIFMVHETPRLYGQHGVEMHAAEDGRILWSISGNGRDVGRGVAIDLDPRYPGTECWGSRGGLMSATGEMVPTQKPGQTNFAVWWDGDLLREILDRETVSKWDHVKGRSLPLLTASDFGARTNNSTKATPALSADILGDWREEVILRHRDNDALMIFTTTIPTEHRIPTLMHDPQYRVSIAWQNVGYNQPPHPGFHLGPGMKRTSDSSRNNPLKSDR